MVTTTAPSARLAKTVNKGWGKATAWIGVQVRLERRQESLKGLYTWRGCSPMTRDQSINGQGINSKWTSIVSNIRECSIGDEGETD